ncbi:helix-turn-helix domain-containing protein [Paracoccus alkanivorans]|uniref:XRE family transcriptional regulator n=1 Tax=Paracoccus alkanivorans TaxID=2116655 RepID=A0A3M0M2T4_9RHOB|nr:XRE family transcriptional regulator [Paracoccus alkanivorans]RMC29810.1 XRE family transcriptional regulator [Paracoccus alkanivorans]
MRRENSSLAQTEKSTRAISPPIGVTVQALRKRSGLTLNDLSQSAGISLSAVSKIENGQVSPTYDTILRLATGLKVEVAELFGSKPREAAAGRLVVTRAGEGPRQSTPHYEYQMLCAGLATKEFTPLLTRISARSISEFDELQGHSGEEFFYVMSGSVVLHSHHYAMIHLNSGDSCYFDSSMGHALTSSGEEDALVLWIATRVHGILEKNG